MLTKRCCSVTTQYPSRMNKCMHSMESSVGTPKILDFAFTRDIHDVSEARVHSDIQLTAHTPISIKVNGVRVISWNMEGLCKREADVKETLKELLRMFSNDPVLFLFQEVFLSREVKPLTIHEKVQSRMSRLLPGYTFLSDGYTGCIAIPPNLTYDNVQYINTSIKGKKCTVVTVVYKGIRTNIANIHLKSIVLYPITGKHLQQKEMQSIIENTHGPTLFMGDFNTERPEKLFGNRTKRRRLKRG